MRSDILKKNIETLPHRALLMSAGLKKRILIWQNRWSVLPTVITTLSPAIFI